MSREEEFIKENKDKIFVVKENGTSKYMMHFEPNGKNIKCRVVYVNEKNNSKYIHAYDESNMYLTFYENRWVETSAKEMREDLENFQLSIIDFVNDTIGELDSA